MTQPTPYKPAFSFAGYQRANPLLPLLGDKVDQNNVLLKDTIDDICDNLARIQRDDGELASESVGLDQLKPELRVGLPVGVALKADQDTASDDDERWVTKAVVEDQVDRININRRTIALSGRNIEPSDTDSRSSAINSVLAELKDLGGGELVIDHQANYLADGQINLGTGGFGGKIVVNNRAGGIIKGMSGLTVPLLFFADGDGPAPNKAEVHLHEVIADISNTAQGDTSISPTGFTFHYLKRVYTENCKVIGSYDPVTGVGKGDSGMTSIGCEWITHVCPDIRQVYDAAHYDSWDDTGGPAGLVEIISGYWEKNFWICTAKRNLGQIVFRGGKGLGNAQGISVQASGTSPGLVEPGQKLRVESVIFEKTRANILVARNGCKAEFINNTIDDVGYYYDGSGPAGTNARVFNFVGAPGALVMGNTLRMPNWTPNGEIAFAFSNILFNGLTLYTGGGHVIQGNRYGTADKAWSRYATGGSDGTASEHSAEKFINVGVSNRYSSFHADSSVRYTIPGDPEKYHYRGGVLMTEAA